MPQTGLEDKKNHNERRELFSVCYPWTVSDASQLCWMKAWLQSDEDFCLYRCNHEILHIQSQMYLSSHNLTWLCQLASFCAGLRKQSVFLCIWTDNFLWLFLETWGWTFVFFFFSISFANEISECLTEFWLLVLFLMSLQLSLLQDDSHCSLNAYVWMPIVGSLATASRWKPRLAEARLMLNLSFSLQEKGHCCELMTEQCSEMFDYPALYLCLLPPTAFSFPGHSDIFLLCYLLSFKWDFAALTVVDWATTGTSAEPLPLDTSPSFELCNKKSQARLSSVTPQITPLFFIKFSMSKLKGQSSKLVT